jgi:energy-converting hydrogenase Eha subunit C
MLTFLPRQNPINKFFSLYAARLARRGKIIVIVVASLLYVGIVGAIFKIIVK